MFLLRSLLVLLVLLMGHGRVQAQGGGHRRGCTHEREVETAAPTVSAAAAARCHDAGPSDALRLPTAQAHALAAEATLEVRALALALTPADAEQTTRHHLRIVVRLLTVSQLVAYGQLRQAPETAGLLAGR